MKRTKKNVRWAVLVLIQLLVIGEVLTACSEDNQNTEIHLSEAKLAEEGYYAYIIPRSFEKVLGLKRDIYIYSLDIHCNQSSASGQGSPLVISYKDSNGYNKLSIQITPYLVLPTPTEEFFSANVNSQWTLEQSIPYYINSDGYIVYSFVDLFGMYVAISISKDYFKRINLGKLMKSLTYIGPPVETVNNPWVDRCK